MMRKLPESIVFTPQKIKGVEWLPKILVRKEGYLTYLELKLMMEMDLRLWISHSQVLLPLDSLGKEEWLEGAQFSLQWSEEQWGTNTLLTLSSKTNSLTT